MSSSRDPRNIFLRETLRMKKPKPVPIQRIILYVKNIPKVADFYQRHFALQPQPSGLRGWLELDGVEGGCSIALHQAAKSQKSGAAMKIVFFVSDLPAFIHECARNGLVFGPVHEARGYEFANAKDPAGNSISISNRGFSRKPAIAQPESSSDKIKS